MAWKKKYGLGAKYPRKYATRSETLTLTKFPKGESYFLGSIMVPRGTKFPRKYGQGHISWDTGKQFARNLNLSLTWYRNHFPQL